jgi:hypothetical protein
MGEVGTVTGRELPPSFDLLDPVAASEHEIDGDEVVSRRARIGFAQHLGSAGYRDHHLDGRDPSTCCRDMGEVAAHRSEALVLEPQPTARPRRDSDARSSVVLMNDETPPKRGSLERMTGFEPATSTLAR